MKVGELIKELQQYPRDMDIFVVDCRSGTSEALNSVFPVINEHESQGALLDYPKGKQYMEANIG
jgi:hypothetical protein